MPTPQRIAKIDRLLANRQQGVVVIEDVYDPHNAAAAFRCCEGFGIQRVCLIFENQKPFNPRRLGSKTSSSANAWLSFELYRSTEECLKQLKSQGYTLLATALTDEATSLLETDLTQPKTALLFGNEHRGLSKKAVEMSDGAVMIPMRGMVQSFNLSVTVGMLLLELTRQRLVTGDADRYALPQAEQAQLKEQWLGRELATVAD